MYNLILFFYLQVRAPKTTYIKGFLGLPTFNKTWLKIIQSPLCSHLEEKKCFLSKSTLRIASKGVPMFFYGTIFPIFKAICV